MMQVRIGVSGWEYGGWRGDFYPPQVPKRRHLEYVTALLGAVEINGTFYSLQSPETYRRWYETSTSDAVLALKGSRYITHMLRLRKVSEALANFFANGMLRLEDKLGPILWQLPPAMDFDTEIFERFCDSLPRDTRAAARIGHRHDQRVTGKVSLSVTKNRPLRHAFEIRDERMLNDESITVLRRHGHALVVADTAGKHPFAEDLTADFVYVRLHGAEELYASGYDERTLRWWARRIRRWMTGSEMKTGTRVCSRPPPTCRARDIYVFFDNDAKVHAPFDALTLSRILGRARDPFRLTDEEGEPLPPPPRLAGGR